MSYRTFPSAASRAIPTVGGSVAVHVPVGVAMTISGSAPAILQTASRIIVPGAGSLVLSGAAPTLSGNYSTSFAGTEDPISEGGKWVNGKLVGGSWNNIKTSGGNALPTHVMANPPVHFDDCIAHIDAAVLPFANNQFAQGTVFIGAGHDGDTEVEILVRFDITSGNARGYEIYWNTQQTDPNIVRWNGPLDDFTRLKVGTTNLGPPVNGDVIRVEIVGTVITVKLNGVTSTSWDTSGDGLKWSSGQPGIGLNPFLPNGDLTTAGFSDFSCGNL